jgi:hypothetical protein
MMPSMTLKRISKEQPMREGEVAVVDYLNGDLTKYLEQETSERIAGINEFKGKVETEQARAEAAEGRLNAAITDEINTRSAETERLTTNLATETSARVAGDAAIDARFPVKAADIADGAVGPTKLDTTILTQLGKLAAVPTIEYGITTPVSVAASSHTDVAVTFSTQRTSVPIVLCSVSCATNVLPCAITSVTNSSMVVRVKNGTTANVDNVSVTWMTVGRDA